ncbi:MAG: 1-deoxy-D-xylulose-5-phosphate reductoisomerase, partial [Acidimicrobiia bacterium]|nr:1-deoxy-D-xylulose-5-phosphate reductoisomerase [Acidimicrobiia bacterium]
GSIGTSTIDLVRRHPDRFRIVGATTHRRVDELGALAAEFDVPHLLVTDPEAAREFRREHPRWSDRLVGEGPDGLVDIVTAVDGAMIVNGVVGAAGMRPTIEALAHGHDVALANKEALVVGGPLVLRAAEQGGGRLWPVDSEHSAIAQCLRGNPTSEVSRLWLTASGGSFRDRDPSTMGDITLAEILDHPTWDMGPKITVDSATMMNKGLEILEAHYLFGIELARIEVVIHRQSIVHSMVEFQDGAFLAQMGQPDMRVPILYALSRGEHQATDVAPFDPVSGGSLTFETPDPARYPCLELAKRAAAVGGCAPIVLNAANEVAVAAVLREELSFVEIPRVIEAALDVDHGGEVASLDEALDVDRRTRETARELVGGFSRTA